MNTKTISLDEVNDEKKKKKKKKFWQPGSLEALWQEPTQSWPAW
jgi:hypothetical protein